MKEIAIYVHIPFCDHKCIYCDFYSIIKTDSKEKYRVALIDEIKHYAKLYAPDRTITSLFFGGGTPSYMEPEYINSIISAISKYFNLNKNAEITFETNPGTVSKEKLREFLSIGINRFSVGIQSFDDAELKFLTRIHNSSAAIKTVEDIYSAGCENISIDLIFNLPNQTKKTWLQNLTTAVSLPVKHVSAYSLILEKGTILNKMVLDKKVEIQGEDFDADLYEETIDFLTDAGFYQYEVSNFTKPGFECKHNKVYWTHNEYLGFGTSAHSFIGNKRWWNYSSLSMYNDSIVKSGNAIRNSEILSEEELFEEFLMLGLRGSGLDLNIVRNTYSKDFFNENISYIRNLIKEGYLEDNNSILQMTKKGYLICDEIVANLITNI